MKSLQIVLAIITTVIAMLGLAGLFVGLKDNSSAPAQAAVAAVVVAGILPFYVIARCVEMINGARR